MEIPEIQPQQQQQPQEIPPGQPNMAVLAAGFGTVSTELQRFTNIPAITDTQAIHNELAGLGHNMQLLQNQIQDMQQVLHAVKHALVGIQDDVADIRADSE